MFGLPPHEVIAQNPLRKMDTLRRALSRGAPCPDIDLADLEADFL